jgi:hypothetical protein
MAAVLAGLGPGAASASTCVSWTGLQPPSPGSASNGLSGVAVVSSCGAWAVGSYSNGTTTQALIVHWNGTAWTQQTSPNPGSAFNTLYGVAATSATNAWAVGYYDNGGNTPDRTLIEHWNGTVWKQVPSPNPGGSSGASQLFGVAAISATNAWAVGFDPNSTLIVHWNGTAWKQVPSPSVSGADLSGVAAVSATNVWAVGASGEYPSDQTLIEHWNGSAWKQVPSPNPDPSTLSGVAATSATNAWAVGTECMFCGSDAQNYVPLIEHWNGTAWQQQPTPSLNNSHLLGVAATSATNAWAVGTSGGGSLMAHWNGTAWKRQPSPNPGQYPGSTGLGGVAATSATNVWAVGGYSNGGASQTLALHCC